MQLPPDDFTRATRLGLGRGILAAEHGNLDAILHVMLHDTTYDQQVEGTRGWYAVELARESGRMDELTDMFTTALNSMPRGEERDEKQRLATVSRLIDERHPYMREVLYERTAAHIHSDSDVGITKVIGIDGVEAVPFLREQFASAGRDLSEVGAQFVYAADNPEAFADLPEFQRPERQRSEPKTKRVQPSYTYADLLDYIATGQPTVGYARRWGRRAKPDDITQAAEAFRDYQGDNQELLLAHIAIFAVQFYPFDPSSLIILAQNYTNQPIWSADGMSVEAMLPFQAYRALSLIAHPAVRDFALVQMAQGKHIEHVIGLLVKNYEPGDWQLVHELVTQPHERETLHSMGMDVRRLMEKHNSPHAVPALTHLIEYGPCSQCRGEFYRGLDAIDALSLLTKKEIAFDSYDYTREWAQERQT